ncbi:MAG: undecaprenyldiphospho-muramoylpentapeptide beta-N-acetylglucosaminyltransferase [Bacteroidia bacterium]|nr:undecaprenyldiphospho-muramoylpentapeptide beta-N-acetylglucosaminyltransferase [Bacteroidia bacterium]HQV00060.1 undecaprenyldiphospho-muramoylpentapeptide beta-N-acetylglucosaminyltransferase [Bacteroidia bacterium]
MHSIRAIISGGGTGGHIFPAIAIANALKKINPENEILFVGAKGRMEMEKVPAAGYRIEGLWISGFQRKLTLDNLSFPFKLISSLYKAARIIKTFKPNVAVGVGGYASGPLLQQAASKNIPCLIQEQNSYPGITNKILASKVQRICVAYDGMDKYFDATKIVKYGNPVRDEMLAIAGKRNDALAFFKLNTSHKVILVVGGSLGARTINQSIEANLKNFADTQTQVIWQTGKAYYQTAVAAAKNFSNVVVVDFITRMDLAFAVADIIVSRAGASTLSELAIIGKPAILIPSPNVAEDHQTKNAQALVKHNAAILVTDTACNSQLWPAINNVLQDDLLAEQLSKNISAMALHNAAHHIAIEVIALAQKQKVQ